MCPWVSEIHKTIFNKAHFLIFIREGTHSEHTVLTTDTPRLHRTLTIRAAPQSDSPQWQWDNTLLQA